MVAQQYEPRQTNPNVITLPGNFSKDDLVHLLEGAALAIEDPSMIASGLEHFPATLRLLARGIK